MDVLVKRLPLRLHSSIPRNSRLITSRSAHASATKHPSNHEEKVSRQTSRRVPPPGTDLEFDPKNLPSFTTEQSRGKSGSEIHAQVRKYARNDILTDDEIFHFLVKETRSVRRFYLNHFDYRGRIRARHRNVVFRTDSEGELVLTRPQLASALEDWETKYLLYRNKDIFNFKGRIRQRPGLSRERTERGRFKRQLKIPDDQSKEDRGLIPSTFRIAEAYTRYQEEEIRIVEEQLEKIRLDREGTKKAGNDSERKSQVREKEG